ncbi:MAG: ATP-binding protein [Caulobacteraceae bacterium]
MSFSMPDAEVERLKALYDFAVLDSLPEARFDRLTALAADLFDAPIALVSLIDRDRQWFKSRHGLDAAETPRAWAFCDYAIKGERDEALVVEDASLDPRFADNPLVTGELGIRFYAGAPLTTADGHNVGTLCVIDQHARDRPSAADLNRLTVLARMVIDELELARATREVAEQKRVLELAEAMSGVGHWRYIIATGAVYWSDELYHIHGMDRASFDPNLDEGLGFYHPEDRVVVAELMAKAIAMGEGFAFQMRLVLRNGETRHVSCRASCEFDVHGAPSAVVGAFQDVTAEVDRLNTLAQSEARYRLLADNASDMVSQLQPDGRITFITPSCFKILGYTPEEMVGVVAAEIIHPDDVQAVRDFYRSLGAHQPAPVEATQFRARHRDGRWIWLEGQPHMFFDEDTGKPAMIQDTVRDISGRKMLELELGRAREEAEAAALVKSEFLANMSHELRTPLTSIVGFSGLLLNTVELSPQGKRYVERVSQASGTLLTIVNDILDFSKLEAGQVEIDKHPADTVGMLEGALELLRPQAEAKGLTLVADYQNLPASVVMDEARVRQVLLNLLSNAVKFTAAGGVTVRANYDRGRLRCEVIDTGEGVPVDRLDRLFKRFSQVDASTTRSHGGTGLGLAICKGLAEAMGGTVGADSRVGEGSRFWLDIPCPIAPAPAAATDPAGSAEGVGQGLRLLVADDNRLNRELVRIILETYGVEVIDAGSGGEALELAQLSRFDIILMDIHMPDLEGPAVAAAIRASQGPNVATPIIAFSADVLEEDSPTNRRGLFDGYLAKPILAADLLTAVSGWADVRQAPLAAAKA